MAEGRFRESLASPCFIKCVKCLKDAVHPVVTSCRHTICRECFDAVVKEREESLFKCPFCGCNSDSSGNSPPPSNAFLDVFQETFAKMSGAAFVRNCSICTNKGMLVPAIKVCLDCPGDRFLCQVCSDSHSSFLMLSSHSLIPVEDYVEGIEFHKKGEEMCAIHPSRIVDVVCSTCGVRMCMLCSMTKKCLKAVAPLTSHTPLDKEEVNLALKEDIEKACEECSVNLAEVDRLMKVAQDEVAEATADAEAVLQKLDDHRAAVRGEWEKVEKHMSEMRSQLKASQQVRIDECKGMVKKLADVRQLNERGKVLGERAVCKAPKEDLSSMLAEVQLYQISAPAIDPPCSSVLVFTGPDLVEIQKKMESVGGSLIDHSLYPRGPPVINHRVLTGAVPYDCHRMGSSLIEADYINSRLCEVDDEGGKTVIHSGDAFMGTCSTSDGSQLLAVTLSSHRLYTFSRDRSGTFQLLRNPVIPKSSYFYGIHVSTSGLSAVSENANRNVCVLNTEGQKVKSMGPSVGEEAFGLVRYNVWSPDEKYLYVTNCADGSIPASVVCISMSTDSVQWKTTLSDPWNIHLVRGELYVTQFNGSNVTVLDPKDGSILRTHTCPGKARGVYAGDDGTVTIVSY